MKTVTLFVSLIFFSPISANYLSQLDKKTQQKVKQDLLLVKQFEAIKQRQGIIILTVGPGLNCDTNSIQNAINSGVDEVRVTNNQTYFENLVIDDISITIRGGFADCTSANNNNQSNSTTQVNGGSFDSVVKVQGSSQDNSVILESLNIRNGANNIGGGVRINSFIGSLLIENSIIQFNTTSGSGSGVYLAATLSGGSNSTVIIKDTKILNNTTNAGTGAGLYCGGNRARVLIHGDSEIKLNNSQTDPNIVFSGNGGGLFLESSCSARIYSPSQINGNTAERTGGGIFMDTTATLFLIGRESCQNITCLGVNDSPVEISNNQAGFPDISNVGGGIYMRGNTTSSAETELHSSGGLLVANNQARLGAGIYAENDAFISIYRRVKPCWDNNRCIYFANNRTTTVNGTGGGIFNDSSNVNIKHGYFEDNRADVATAIYSKGTGAITRIQSSVFNNNGSNGSDSFNDLYVVRAYDDAKIEVVYSTFADNNANTAVFGIRNSSDALTLTSSIVHDISSGDVLLTDNGSVQTNCVMAHEVTSIAGTNVSLNNPDFVDRTNRDYHLAANSPAIDYCNNLAPSIPDVDIDFTTRGYDDPKVEDNFTGSFFDIGADEVSDIIFKNGFE